MLDREPEHVLDSREAYHGRIISVRVDEVRLPNGHTTKREIVEHPGAVGIVASDGKGRVAMVRQYRLAIGRETLEIPAGTREPPEPDDECARRELAEETGLTAKQWSRLVGFFSSPGFCNEYLAIFLAQDLSAAANHPEEDETISLEWIDLNNVPELISTGVICDAKSVAGLLSYLCGTPSVPGR